uniref:Uncharacterized protein n=1 Tax=Eutreptiella gymnastica TaxID=73025 RepID=A0A7S1IVP5_9EUGL|mmetsp:Transcript_45527/g.81424  ORF Transcript_45527/g.81424 Transcript_45527/m.81424 type:complete len:271 (+) Transcript_45527:76-888(+)
MLVSDREAIKELSSTLKRLTGATGLADPKVSTLLANWAQSHSHAKAAMKRAVQKGLGRWLEKLQVDAINEFGATLIPGDGACELLISMSAPKRAFRVLSKYFGQRTAAFTREKGWQGIKRPICSHAAFRAAWRRFAAALTLGPTLYNPGPPLYVAVYWPVHNWAEYINSRPPLLEHLDFTQPLGFILRGDGYPTAGASWTLITVSLTNFGEKARSPSFLWCIGLAACSEKDLEVVANLWVDNIQVTCLACHLPLTCQTVRLRSYLRNLTV